MKEKLHVAQRDRVALLVVPQGVYTHLSAEDWTRVPEELRPYARASVRGASTMLDVLAHAFPGKHAWTRAGYVVLARTDLGEDKEEKNLDGGNLSKHEVHRDAYYISATVSAVFMLNQVSSQQTRCGLRFLMGHI